MRNCVELFEFRSPYVLRHIKFISWKIAGRGIKRKCEFANHCLLHYMYLKTGIIGKKSEYNSIVDKDTTWYIDTDYDGSSGFRIITECGKKLHFHIFATQQFNDERRVLNLYVYTSQRSTHTIHINFSCQKL